MVFYSKIMKKIQLYSPFFWTTILACLIGCNGNKTPETIRFVTSAEYPPFEFQENGVIKGFDIDLAELISQELGKKATFQNMKFCSVLPSLLSGRADAAISTITITEARKKNFDFSEPYYFGEIAAVFKNEDPITHTSELTNKKIACQLGSTMEIWLKEHFPKTPITAMDSNPQAIELLKAGHVNVVVLDSSQASVFCAKNPGLSYKIIAQAEDGYGIAFVKGSPWVPLMNKAIEKFKANGTLEQLKSKWITNNSIEN